MLEAIACFFGFHSPIYAGEDDRNQPSSEKWYWHRESCTRCHREWLALNGHCKCKGEF